MPALYFNKKSIPGLAPWHSLILYFNINKLAAFRFFLKKFVRDTSHAVLLGFQLSLHYLTPNVFVTLGL